MNEPGAAVAENRAGERAVTGRLAPSPTGLLHLGNAWAFLLAWLGARTAGGRVVLRMEDIDPERSRREWAEAIVEDLQWLGLDWDEGPYEQSQSAAYYEQAFAALHEAGLVYPCYCTRKELRTLAGAPHGFSERAGGPGENDAGAPYPGTCRWLTPAERAEREKKGRRAAWRLACPQNERVAFDDLVLGPKAFTLEECGGDFPLRRSDGVWSYQLAVTVDDARMGVTQVVRGEDILISTPRQILLLGMMGHRPPHYAHIPLLSDEAGERLAKRHQSLSLRALREAGVRSEAVIGWLGSLALNGMGEGLRRIKPEAMTPAGLCARLREEGRFPWERLTLSQGPEAGNDGAESLLRVPDDVSEWLR